MKSITIQMDERLVRLAQAKASSAGKSLADYIAALVAEQIGKPSARYANPQLAALERFLAGPKLDISIDGRMPTAEERNARR